MGPSGTDHDVVYWQLWPRNAADHALITLYNEDDALSADRRSRLQ